MNKEPVVTSNQIENRIFTFREVQVMTDRDLAELYQVETRVLNQAVKRNAERFPEMFRFQLNQSEFEIWKSQTVMSNEDKMGLRRPHKIPHEGLFFDGQVFDAYELTSRIIRSANHSIVLIDNYIDESTIAHLAKKKKEVNVLLLTKGISRQITLDVQKANEQYGNFELKLFNKSHDRFLIIDNNDVYHLGASLKDLGRKWFAFSKLDKESVESLMNEIGGLI
jgi:hypothetical protein